MAMNRRDFVRGGVAAFTVGFAAPSFLTDIARAQGRSRRNLVVLYSERRQRRTEHARSLHRSAVFRAPPEPGHPRRHRSPDRVRQRRQRPRPEPAPDRSAHDLQRRPARGHPAHRVSQLEPLALSGHRHLVDRRSVGTAGRWLAGTLSRPHAGAGRSADRVVDGPRDATHAARADGRRGLDSKRRRICVREPEHRRRRAGRAAERDPDRVARARRSTTPRVRQLDGASGVRDPRPRRSGRDVPLRRSPIPTTGLDRPCELSPAPWLKESARASSGSRPAAMTPTPARTPTWPTVSYNTLMTTLNGRPLRLLPRPARIRDCSPTRSCCSSPSSAAASARTAATAPTTAPPA